MIAILAEDHSDAETLVVIVRKLLADDRAPVYRKGFSGCGELCRKGSAHIDTFRDRGATHFIVCHDADREDPDAIRRKVHREILARTGVSEKACIVVPVQELEAWIIADEDAISTAIPSLRIPEVRQPEATNDPKEWLENSSRVRSARPLYSHATHNPVVARHLNLEKVARKCPSFVPLSVFVHEHC